MMGRIFAFVLVLTVVGSSAFVWATSIRCGFGKAENYNEMTPALESCAAKGNANAMFWQSVILISEAVDEDEERRAANLLIKAAEAGSFEAMNDVGLARMTGAFGLEQDFVKGREWLAQATEMGDALAPINLARIYAGGYGVEQDLGKALDLVKLSAERGYRNARCVLYELELLKTDVDFISYFLLGYNRCNIWQVPDELFALAPDVVERKYPWALSGPPNYPIDQPD